MISSIIIAVVVLGVLLLVGIAIIFAILNIVTIQEVQGEEDIPAWQKAQETATPNFQCLLFNDGRLAVLDSECDTIYPEVSWFLSKGYHIDVGFIDDDTYVHELYMSR